MLGVKIKAIIILSLLIIAIGVPIIFYAMNVKGEVNEKPVAIISSPLKSCVNVPVEFSGNKSRDNDGFIVTYLWDFGDGHKSSGKYVNHTYMSVGNYTVTLAVYDNNGAMNEASKKIEIEIYEEKVPVANVNDLLKNTGDYIGHEIRIRGIFGYGRNYSFYMVNESGYRGLRVYCEKGAKKADVINYGDKIEVLGRFTVYKGELEIRVENNSRDYVIVVGHGGRNGYADISLNKWENYNNSFVHFLGEVSGVNRSYKFKIGTLLIYEEMNATSIGSPAIGDTFEIWGFLTYYKPRNYSGYNEVVIRAHTDDLSKYVKSNYTDATVSDILSNVERYNNTGVHISQCLVTDEYASWKFWISDENSSNEMQVYVEKGGNIQGMIFSEAKLEMWGEFSYYKGIWEIKIRNATDDEIIVLNKPTYMDVSVPELLRNSSQYENKSVHSWGIVSWLYQNASSGLTLFGLYCEGKELTVVGFNGSNISSINEGYYADVYGTFTSYQGEWEIKIEPESYDFAVGKPQNYAEVNITQILNNPLYYNNTLVYIPWSIVTYVYNASWLFYVSNSTTNEDISVYIEKGASLNATIYTGAVVKIWGMVTQYQGSWEIKIRNGTNDTVESTTHIEYITVNITDILNNTSNYNNTNVHIPNATVVSVYARWLFWVSNSTNNTNDIAVYVEGGVSVPTVGRGDFIEIYGNVTYHNGSYEIKIRYGTPDCVIVLHSTAKYVNFSYIHETDNNGTLIHLGEQVIVNGTLISSPDVFSYVSSSTGKPLLKIYIENTTGGVLVFGYNINYTNLNWVEGDVLKVRGTLDQYNGEAELKISSLDYIEKIGHTSPISPLNISTGYFQNWSNAEKIEGALVHVNGTVKSINTQYHYIYIDDGSGQVEIYFKSPYVNMTNISVGENISVTGVVSQYDKTSPYTSYYEIMPRYQSDLTKINSTKSENGRNGLKNEIPHSFNEVILKWKIDIVLTAEDMWAH